MKIKLPWWQGFREWCIEHSYAKEGPGRYLLTFEVLQEINRLLACAPEPVADEAPDPARRLRVVIDVLLDAAEEVAKIPYGDADEHRMEKLRAAMDAAREELRKGASDDEPR
jgi:hypothetical protein